MITKDRSIYQGNVYDGMEPFVPNWRDPVDYNSGVPEESTDYPERRFYVSDVSPLINWIEETPSIRSGRPPRKAELSRSDLGIEPRDSVVFFTP
jgi:hypothetical protein